MHDVTTIYTKSTLAKIYFQTKTTNILFKDAPVSLNQNSLHLTFNLYLSRESYLRKYKKTAKSSYPFMYKIDICVFMFRPITLKLLNSWTTIDEFLI